LWSGNETGLYRFDGSKYVEYGVSDDEKGFAGYTVTDIAEDSDGTIWVGTSSALNKLDQVKGTFRHFFPDSSVNTGFNNFIRSIREDHNGLLWILTQKNVYSFNRKSEEFEHFLTDSLSWYPPGYYFVPEDQCYAEDRYGNKWFTTYRGLYLFSGEDGSFKMVLPDPANPEMEGVRKVLCVNTDREGNVWIGTDGEGLVRWNYRENKPERIDTDLNRSINSSFNSVSAILGDKNGTIWSFGKNSFSNYNPADKSIRLYEFIYDRRTIYESSVSEVIADQTFQQQNGSIWFLNKVAGLMLRFDPEAENLLLYRVPNFIAYQCVMDKTESFWFACIRNNIWRLVTANLPYLVIPVANSSHVAQIHRGAFLEDIREQVYLLTLQGIYKFKKFEESSSFIP
jgi:ligand-binding sensor domain-containing protein